LDRELRSSGALGIRQRDVEPKGFEINIKPFGGRIKFIRDQLFGKMIPRLNNLELWLIIREHLQILFGWRGVNSIGAIEIEEFPSQEMMMREERKGGGVIWLSDLRVLWNAHCSIFHRNHESMNKINATGDKVSIADIGGEILCGQDSDVKGDRKEPIW
jgi:hypothetical protein